MRRSTLAKARQCARPTPPRFTSAASCSGQRGILGQVPRRRSNEDFQAKLQQSLNGQVGKGKAAGDPWCLGFFVDNEIAWGEDTSLAVAALQSPAEQAAKKVFIEDLKAKYGEIAKLNAAWGTQARVVGRAAADREGPGQQEGTADLLAFYTETAEQYFKVIARRVKEVAPEQLYLGCRFAWVNDLAAKAGAKYCDVVSYNLYRNDICGFKMPGNRTCR